jgi:formiminotetrahydrofolate cyclodeaminase
MNISQNTLPAFIDLVAGKQPAPGGGGASALVGAVGVALGNMVGSLTTGKKKYAPVEADIQKLMAECRKLEGELIALIDKDAEDFVPLSKAYGLPHDTPEQQAEKDKVMEQCLRTACGTPLEIMRKCARGIELCKEAADKGSKLALSDAGVGAAFCKAALHGASLNVYINTKSMKDTAYAKKINEEADGLIAKYTALADQVFDGVKAALIKK